MSDPVAGVGEMARVTAPGGRVSACVWDHAGGTGALSASGGSCSATTPRPRTRGRCRARRKATSPGCSPTPGCSEVEETLLTVRREFATFEEWWEPFTLAVGPAGAYVRSLNQIERAGLEGALREELGDGPMTIQASAWTATGLV